MKIHPLFYRVIEDTRTIGKRMDAWNDWQAAGKPVVEEEPTMSGLMQEAEQAETKERLRARIRELEAKLARRNSSLSELTVPGYEDQIRNAALEEAAKEADSWCNAPVQHWPSWLQDSNEAATMHLIEVTRTNFRRFAARIRALKKEAW